MHGRALLLASYIKDIFLRGELLGKGEEFIEGLSVRGGNTFWLDHQPAFHAYDYGANIKIEINEEIANLEQEQQGEEEEEDSNDDQYPHPDAKEDSLFLPVEAHSTTSLSPLSHSFRPDHREIIGRRRLEDKVGHSEEHDLPTTAGARRIIITTSAPLSSGHSHRLEDKEEGGSGEVLGDNKQEERFIRWINESKGAVITHSTGVAKAQQQQQGEEEDGLTHQHRSNSDKEDEEEDHRGAPSSSSGGQGEHDALYSDGLRRLREALEAKYNLDNISHISYALAINIHCTAASTHPGGGRGPTVCLLANRNRVASADMLSFGFFQGYSNLKRSIHHRPDDLLASHGLATAALTIPSTEAQHTARLRDKQQRLLAQVRGQLTPENPSASTPFARERQRVEAALQANEFAFRFEQVISIDAPRLVRQRQNFNTVLQPIFQLMRLFLKEKQLYAGILRRFPPEIFPGILVAFTKVLEAAIVEIDRRFREGGSKGLGIALSEGIAALDRLGNFCFTGDQRVLPTKVIRLLRTIDSLKTYGWPFLSPRMLDIREGRGLVNLVGWPQLNNRRPVLMHVASLEYHYDRSIAANRHSQLWFAELGGRSIDGIDRMTTFLHEVFRDLWVPEIVAFICRQVRRGLNRSLRGGGGGLRNDDDINNNSAQAMVALGA
ncbi:uncharacterized protein NECHADRAFT_89203 [Fusarium vanettenii 77-13-4]|uniref:Uncharacterized protein n=1 Tax=Fusarium vanettenii (strain ATCC MYA-4622 / CBS 123669 / FGSC 9596 / NRRL 45880 / 77-13-4) TaxID=660122 RepID=C7ZQH6_FUSV7|nr:uncharacterized protein NECHADRAFT_89203 [Fusarium vanettenii 77-13-4]EEU33729.1 hypothetical protein NECHADRAFT_89203 [Fusarium vanettenii 77-13-4]